MSDCYLSHKAHRAAEERKDDERGFMGKTHVTSAVAIFLLGVAFFPSLTEPLLGTDDIWIIILAALATAGASLIPDLDNTSSTARNSLGPVGHICSEGVRALSATVQTFVKTSRDADEPNPHRGAAHTWPAALILGGLVFLLTKVGGQVTLPLMGAITLGTLFAMLVVFIMCHLALSGLFKPFMRQLNKEGPLGELSSFGFSLAITYGLFAMADHSAGFWWLGIAVAAGCIIHVLGDAFTTSGAPLFFPFPYKGKMWWMVRFTSIKAGGVAESVLFVPVFLILILIASLRILGIF